MREQASCGVSAGAIANQERVNYRDASRNCRSSRMPGGSGPAASLKVTCHDHVLRRRILGHDSGHDCTKSEQSNQPNLPVSSSGSMPGTGVEPVRPLRGSGF